MKTLNKIILIFAVFFFSMAIISSCQKEETNLKPTVQSVEGLTTMVSRNSRVTDCNSFFYNGMSLDDLMDILNCKAEKGHFTNCRYLSCNSDLINHNFSVYNSGDMDDIDAHFATLTSAPISAAEAKQLVLDFRNKVNLVCGGYGVIIDATFSYDFLVCTGCPTEYYINADVTICCDPVLDPKPCKMAVKK